MKTFDGYKKRNLTDKDYALLAGGGHKALDTLFSALSSDTTNAIKITVGGTEKSITTNTLKTSLGLGSNAYTSTAYLPLAGGTMTGALTIKNNSWNNILILNRTSANGTWGPAIQFQYDGTTNGTLTMTSNQLYIGDAGSNRYKAWHAGNDGSGSGLDADLLDGYHASGLVKFYLSPMTSNAPADSAKSWFVNTMPSSSGAIVYNVPGSEKTIIVGKSSGTYGHMLQLNYDDNYLRILRYLGGNWKTTDWEKISAGYADSSGNADTVDNIHATGFLRWKGMLNIGGHAPFQAVVDIMKDTSKLNDGGLAFYSYAGDEYTVLIGSRNDANRYGNALKWGYANKYLWMIRMTNGSPLSSDWEKISAGYADSSGNADTVDGLHVHSGRNNEANKIVRTDANGYILAGWINTTSGDMGTTTATRVYCSNDAYIRYKTLANFSSDIAGQLYWANIKVSTSSNAATSPTFESLWINNSYFFKLSGTTFTCQGGTTFTLPSSNINTSTALLWTTASAGPRDTGIFYNSADFAFIANSNDHGAVFAVYDTDVTQDFEAGAREISVPGNGGALWARGGFSKNGSSNSYVLLGGGGHKAESSLSVANADTVDGYHATSLWRSDGGVWNPSANIKLNASANGQEWSFDITRNGHTNCYWHVWDSSLSSMLKVNADNGKVYAPYNFVGNLEGNATTATTATTATDSAYTSSLGRYRKTIQVDGDANTYYPVVIDCSSSKVFPHYISIWKNLGSKTASYSNNHENGTSSMWLLYECRSMRWDGNGGYCKTLYRSMPYAYLCAETNYVFSSVGVLCVWLRGGGTTYEIALNYNLGVTIYYSKTNLHPNSEYPAYVEPRTSSGNSGIYCTVNSHVPAPASDVYSWAKAATKPTYTYSEVGAAAASHTHSYLPLSGGTLTGNLYAPHFYENSDIRYKKVLKNLSINSNNIANLPLFDFEWIENNSIGTGTSAQAVLQILPNLVSGTDKLTLDYGVLGTIAGITACKELVTLKSELQELKEKVKLLEDKLSKYENTL